MHDSLAVMLNFEEGEILAFDKPYGWTSFQVVGRVRWWLKRRCGIPKIKVGHAGTLDPLATGVLIVCTGKATKKIEELQMHTKEYVATLKLGATTPSFDREKEEDAQYPTEHLSRELVEERLKDFQGVIEQIPPMFSAVKVNGKRAYKLARKGEEVYIEPKKIVIEDIELLSYTPNSAMVIKVVCGKGTYIRSLARDLGEALGTGAYLTDLRRTRVGEYKAEDCIDPEHFVEWLEASGHEFTEPTINVKGCPMNSTQMKD